MIKIAHLVHPVIVHKSSDLVAAQPITFATMSKAREFAQRNAGVSCYAIQYHDEKRIELPQCFTRTPDLTRAIGDIKTFKKRKKLALIGDLLTALYRASQADYFIYTNVDIALQPFFYRTVSKIIAQEYDAFIINRRTIPAHYKNVEEIPLMYAELGEKHPGWDCFVFKRALYPHFALGTVCIGTDWIGRSMIANLSGIAKQFKVFTDLHLTFHIGDGRPWESSQLDDYARHNRDECGRILTNFDKKYGPFDRKKFPGVLFRHLERSRGVRKNNLRKKK